jgi:hypothetical protein
MATCLINMFPENAQFAWDTFTEELKMLSDEDMVAALSAISKNARQRQKLLTFVRLLFMVISFF